MRTSVVWLRPFAKSRPGQTGKMYYNIFQNPAHTITKISDDKHLNQSKVTDLRIRDKWMSAAYLEYRKRKKQQNTNLEVNEMSGNRSNRVEVPEAKAAMDRFKTEVASELGVNLKEGYNGDLTSREAGSIGGEMVRRMIRKQEEQMK